MKKTTIILLLSFIGFGAVGQTQYWPKYGIMKYGYLDSTTVHSFYGSFYLMNVQAGLVRLNADRKFVTTTLAESDIPSLSISKVTGLQDSLDSKGSELQAIASEISVTENTSYNAFPCLVRYSDGSLLTIYRKGVSHESSDGIIEGKISTDNGQTWGSSFTVLSETSWNLIPASLTLLANGNTLMTYARNDAAGITNSTVRSILLNSSGVPTSSPVTIGLFTDWSSSFGQSIQLANGDILTSIYGVDSGETYAKVYKSTDNGASWSFLSNLALNASIAYSEASLILLSNGTIVAAVRDDTNFYISTTKSTDGGATWSAVTQKFIGTSALALGQLGDKIVVGYRHTISGSIGTQMALRYSTDEGATFSEPSSISLFKGGGYMYGAFVNIGEILGYVYAKEGAVSTVSDVFFKYVSDQQSLSPIPVLNTKGLVNEGDIYTRNSNIWFGGTDYLTPPTGDVSINVDTDGDYTGAFNLQAGSTLTNSTGGGFSMFGESHATKGGWAQANLSSLSGAKFAVNNNVAGTGTDVFTVNRSGDLYTARHAAVGATINPWGSIFTALQIGAYGSFVAGRSDLQNQLWTGTNSYYDGTNWKYKNTAAATRFYQADGGYFFEYAPSGTAGTNITWVNALTIAENTGIATFSASPIAPTPTANDNSTKVATTAYVDALNVTSSEYTPTYTSGANISSVTAVPVQYMRIGNRIHVEGYVTVNITAANTATQIKISLPVSSNFTQDYDCQGTFMVSVYSADLTDLKADQTSDTAYLQWEQNQTGSSKIGFSFTYKVQ